MVPGDRDTPDELSPRELARLRHRDRKRSTTMVVDNAALKRTTLALARRRAPPSSPPPQSRPSEPEA